MFMYVCMYDVCMCIHKYMYIHTIGYNIILYFKMRNNTTSANGFLETP